MKTRILSLAVAVLLALSLHAAASDKKQEKKKTSPEFQKIMSLEGSWTGKGMMEGKEQPMQTKFRVTSGGSAVEEVLFPGTPHEMVDVYFMDGDKLMMTHYCAMGNQPRMKMSSSKGNTLDFTYVDATGLPSADAPHMSGISLTVKGKDKLIEDWSSTAHGETKKMDSFVFTREQ